MLDKYARNLFNTLLTPIARLLARMGVTPDAVSIVGTLGVCLGALVLYPMGELFWGTVWVTVFVFSDLVDGILARLPDEEGRVPERTEGQLKWGSFLDSTLDRVADFAIFGALAYWWFTGGERTDIAVLSLLNLCLGALVSYARAKAESLGLEAKVGIAERSERIVLMLVFAGLAGLGVTPWALFVVLCLLALGSLITFFQRVLAVRRQTIGVA